jgi:putative endonuclease
LLTWRQLPPARFDVVTLEGQGPQWLQAAFDAS